MSFAQGYEHNTYMYIYIYRITSLTVHKLHKFNDLMYNFLDLQKYKVNYGYVRFKS